MESVEPAICATCGRSIVKIETDQESWWVHLSTGQRQSFEKEEHYAGTYRHVPEARRTDPDTSHQAAEQVDRIRAADLRDWITHRLENVGPETDEELYTAAMWEFGDIVTPSGLRTRRSELVKEGLIEYQGHTRALRSGRQGRLWQRVAKETLF